MMASSISGGSLNYDEVFMQQNLFFSDSLKDLKNLRTQLYSAAEYFELSYTNDDQKQIVANTLRDYAIKALVNTVDHLGSVTYKVNNFLDERVNEMSDTEFKVSYVEQRIRTCQDYTDHEGLSQQSLVINTPKYHKRYVLPVGESMQAATRARLKYQGRNLDDAVRATTRENPTLSVKDTLKSSVRKGRSVSPPARFTSASFTTTATKKESADSTGKLEKRTVSLSRFPILRSGSMSSRSSTPTISRLTTPSSSARQQHPSKPQKSASMLLQAEKANSKDIEQTPSKSKRFFQALLGRHKSKKDDMLYTYLDEY